MELDSALQLALKALGAKFILRQEYGRNYLYISWHSNREANGETIKSIKKAVKNYYPTARNTLIPHIEGLAYLIN